jgi:hypothetical protein
MCASLGARYTADMLQASALSAAAAGMLLLRLLFEARVWGICA